MIKYPVRCVIVEGGYFEVFPGVIAVTPDVSKPHIGERGLAQIAEDGLNVEITLDNGSILMGYECWWVEESVFDEVANKIAKEKKDVSKHI